MRLRLARLQFWGGGIAALLCGVLDVDLCPAQEHAPTPLVAEVFVIGNETLTRQSVLRLAGIVEGNPYSSGNENTWQRRLSMTALFDKAEVFVCSPSDEDVAVFVFVHEARATRVYPRLQLIGDSYGAGAFLHVPYVGGTGTTFSGGVLVGDSVYAFQTQFRTFDFPFDTSEASWSAGLKRREAAYFQGRDKVGTYRHDQAGTAVRLRLNRVSTFSPSLELAWDEDTYGKETGSGPDSTTLRGAHAGLGARATLANWLNTDLRLQLWPGFLQDGRQSQVVCSAEAICRWSLTGADELNVCLSAARGWGLDTFDALRGGGSDGVRGYAVDEITGDILLLCRAEWGHELVSTGPGRGIQTVCFLDLGASRNLEDGDWLNYTGVGAGLKYGLGGARSPISLVAAYGLENRTVRVYAVYGTSF